VSAASCMGGWCRHRNQCELHTKDDRSVPVERLCERGQERPVMFDLERVDGWIELRRRPWTIN